MPSEATFSRALEEFVKTNLPARVHEVLIRAPLGQQLIAHIARDVTAIHARERAVFMPCDVLNTQRRYTRGVRIRLENQIRA